MRTAQLVRRNLTYFWRTNLAVVFGVAIAVAVLAGALLVGDSVRASLRDLVLHRLGKTDYVISTSEFFREQLASDLPKQSQSSLERFASACPLIALAGNVGHESNKRRASAVRVYGIDERFWKFHGRQQPTPHDREVLISESLARELETRDGESLLIRINQSSAIPVESLHGRKEALGIMLRLTINKILTPEALGEFSLQPQQGPVHAVFVPLKLLQRELGQENKVNTILISERDNQDSSVPTRLASITRILKSAATLEDYGIKLRALDQDQAISLERSSNLIDDSLANKARALEDKLAVTATPIFSYLANQIKYEGKAVPYSLVTAVDAVTFDKLKSQDVVKPVEASQIVNIVTVAEASPPIILNEWTARDLGATRGDAVALDYYFWHDDGRLETRTANFYLAAIIPISDLAADRDLVPDYPGISESPSLGDWDPPFPIDLKLVRKQDEDYWKQYRTTPKAFIQLSKGQELWQTRFGKLTSIRFESSGGPPSGGRESEPPQGGTPNSVSGLTAKVSEALRAELDPTVMGLSVVAARNQGLDASRGATDFGEYFLYFSFFLVISALLLAALFFKLGIEQRLREIGTLQAIGFSASKIRRIFLAEGLLLSLAGSLLGMAGAMAYGYLVLLGLRTWWVDAVGTTLLTLHVSTISLILGGVAGVVAALICIAWTLRRLKRASTRSLLSGAVGTQASGLLFAKKEARRLRTDARLLIAIASTAVAVGLLLAASLHLIGQAAGFFGGGGLLLVALLFYQSAWLRKPDRRTIQGAGWPAISRMGFRNTTYRPSRSVLCITLIAFSTFIIVAVDAFRRHDSGASQDKKSGSGGFPLMAESLLPIVHDPNSREGREALNMGTATGPNSLANVTLTRFRLRPGDDASCLNLYAPGNPRVLGATEQFISSNRFAFQNSLANSNEEKANPWLLLHRELEQGIVPVIADANSMTYVLHKKLGDELVLSRNEGPVRVRFVGALADSVFQSELLMSEKNFLRLFPDQPGYRFFLIDAPEHDVSTVTATLEDRLADYGFDAVSTGERLANFHRVENTYLSTFQMLGGLGLILGTLGMAAVLLRNVFERRKELALLRAVGYNSTHFTTMVFAENALLLFLGLATGTFCALLAIAPVFFDRGGRLPNISLGFLLLAVLLSGLAASLVATWAALRSPLLPALRAE
jgi:ABC-type antimicrobial peptide transport system permease subunit